MPNIRQIRRRIRSVQSTAKITKAMEMIAASKMRRAQQRVLASRPYAITLLDVLSDLTARGVDRDLEDAHPLLATRETRHVGVVLFTPDRGLSGGLNSNMNRAAGAFAMEQSVPVSFVTVGRKGGDYLRRYERHIVADFTNLGDFPTMADVLPIAHVVMQEYQQGAVDRVYLVYPEYVTTVVQRPRVRQLLPIQPPPSDQSPSVALEYTYEPDSTTVLGSLLPRLVEMWVYHALLETNASEQSARMVAMHSATDAANDMIGSLTLAYNKARQEMITKELLDIVGGVAALEG